jgi:hypothetical protein
VDRSGSARLVCRSRSTSLELPLPVPSMPSDVLGRKYESWAFALI